MGKVITVTGGAGFIGSHVAHWAQRAGHEVRFFDRRGGHDILGDLSALAGSDAVIHLAGVLGTMELFDSVEDAVHQNVIGSHRIADWCLRNDATYVGILVPDVFPSIYCATKVAAHRLTSALHRAKGLKVAHVIAYNAHGPGQAWGVGHPRKFGPTFSMAAWRNEPIPVWGDGSALVDPVPVAVVARMLVDAIKHGDSDAVFDGGLSQSVTVQEIAEEVLHITGSTAGIAYEPMRIGETPTNIAATARGWELLDWDPAGPFREDDGAFDMYWRDKLRETVEWYRAPALALPRLTEVTSGWKPEA